MVAKLKLALIQTSISWQDPDYNRSHFGKILKSVRDVDLIVLPEMFTTGFSMTPEQISAEHQSITVEWMKQMAMKYNSAIAGSIISSEGGEYFNRLYFITADGEEHIYDKRHTFTLAGEDKVYQRGAKKVIIDYMGFRICPMICYDLRFPVWSRNAEDFDVLLYVANWPAPRIDAWDTLLKARAIENMVYCVGVNRIGVDENGLEYTGHSAVYNSLGGKLAYSESEEILYAELDQNHLLETRKKLMFLKDRDSFNLQL